MLCTLDLTFLYLTSYQILYSVQAAAAKQLSMASQLAALAGNPQVAALLSMAATQGPNASAAAAALANLQHAGAAGAPSAAVGPLGGAWDTQGVMQPSIPTMPPAHTPGGDYLLRMQQQMLQQQLQMQQAMAQSGGLRLPGMGFGAASLGGSTALSETQGMSAVPQPSSVQPTPTQSQMVQPALSGLSGDVKRRVSMPGTEVASKPADTNDSIENQLAKLGASGNGALQASLPGKL